jgi:hypothetical protein
MLSEAKHLRSAIEKPDSSAAALNDTQTGWQTSDHAMYKENEKIKAIQSDLNPALCSFVLLMRRS